LRSHTHTHTSRSSAASRAAREYQSQNAGLPPALRDLLVAVRVQSAAPHHHLGPSSQVGTQLPRDILTFLRSVSTRGAYPTVGPSPILLHSWWSHHSAALAVHTLCSRARCHLCLLLCRIASHLMPRKRCERHVLFIHLQNAFRIPIQHSAVSHDRSVHCQESTT